MPSCLKDLKTVYPVNNGYTVIDLNDRVTGYFKVSAQEASSIEKVVAEDGSLTDSYVRTPVPFTSPIVLPFVFTRHLPAPTCDIFMFCTGETISNIASSIDGDVLTIIYEGQEIQLNIFEVVFN